MIFIVNNRKNNKGKVFFSKLHKFLTKKKISFEIATPFEKDFKNKLKKVLADIEFVIILGGDGTILYTFNHFIDKIKKDCVPFFALNIGNVGYISSVDNSKNAFSILKNYIQKDYLSQSCSVHSKEKKPSTDKKKFLSFRSILSKGEINSKDIKVEKRFFLEGFFQKKKTQKKFFALNEITIRRKLNVLVNFECFVNGDLICNLRSDGIILATATGSTAYSLSANGPILNPLLPAYIFNPLCAHSFTFKPLVLSAEDKINIKPLHEVLLSIDGREYINLERDDEIRVELSRDFLPIIKPVGENCYNVLTKKLNWGK